MKILEINPYFFPLKGGIEHRMDDTSKYLTAKGHDVTVLTSRLPGTSEEEVMEGGYKVIRLDSKYINMYNPPYVSSKDVLENIISIDPDIVNYHYRWAPSYNKDVSKYDGKKIYTVHNTWGEGTGVVAMASEINDRLFIKNHLDSFDHLISVSESLRQQTIGRGVDPSKITTIPNCMGSYPEKLSDIEGDFILSLGRLVSVKGIKYLVEAMKKVNSKLIICGKGPEAKNIKKQIHKLGLEDKIEMRGYVSEEEKQKLMSTCKFFVIPSLLEAFGIAAIEQMSFARPIIASNICGLPETVGKGGLLVPSKDPEALTEAMNSLLSDDKLRMELGVEARKQAEYYSWDNHIGRLEELYKAVAEGRNPNV